MEASFLATSGAVCFGLVMGWVTYRTLRRRQGAGQLSDISAVLGAVGGAAITSLPFDDPDVFGAYSIGLAAGFFAYLVVAWQAARGRSPVDQWMGPP